MIVRARFVVPADGPVIEGGALEIRGGRIAAVGKARDLPAEPSTDFGDAVIVPGFVNAHTHLELARLAGRVQPSPDFLAWLKALVGALRSEAAAEQTVRAAVQEGIRESLASGVTLLGDITRAPQWARDPIAQSPLRAVSFGEVIAIGKSRHRIEERLAAATCATGQADRMRVGISPHAPYTVEPAALRACGDRARRARIPLCMHVGESEHEIEFTRDRSGPFVAYLCDVGVWDDAVPASGLGPFALCERTGVLTDQTIIAHGNYATDDDIETIAKSGASVAYCPRTHAAFGHAPHRFRDMMTAGVNVCIGTDSLASNPSLSILDELRFMRRTFSDLSAPTILAMGTRNGAEALGLGEWTGSIAVGKFADLAVIPLDPAAANVGWAAILESERQPVAVYIGGERQPKAAAE